MRQRAEPGENCPLKQFRQQQVELKNGEHTAAAPVEERRDLPHVLFPGLMVDSLCEVSQRSRD